MVGAALSGAALAGGCGGSGGNPPHPEASSATPAPAAVARDAVTPASAVEQGHRRVEAGPGRRGGDGRPLDQVDRVLKQAEANGVRVVRHGGEANPEGPLAKILSQLESGQKAPPHRRGAIADKILGELESR